MANNKCIPIIVFDTKISASVVSIAKIISIINVDKTHTATRKLFTTLTKFNNDITTPN